jgi:hypothetical protein
MGRVVYPRVEDSPCGTILKTRSGIRQNRRTPRPGEAMTATYSGVRPMEDPEGRLELALIEEFLLGQGYDPRGLDALPEDQRRHVLGEASVYASGKLAEIQSRALYVHEMRHQE